ncbi:MAG: MmcQ/YjbR family DNA-binding protein [Chloroflexota bacterium]|nr:MmcQ/YjbR family DNA-binding protein [Chloroflexota bacterium]
MTREEFREYCLSKKGVTEEFPFDMAVAVFKVMGRMFALADVGFTRVNLKCEPQRAMELREAYASVTPGYHMNKRHWNSVAVDGSIEDRLLRAWIDDSYGLVVGKLTRAQRERLEAL